MYTDEIFQTTYSWIQFILLFFLTKKYEHMYSKKLAVLWLAKIGGSKTIWPLINYAFILALSETVFMSYQT